MSVRGCFVTGTDTGVGKSWISAGLMAAARARGVRVVGMKPVASGASGGRNDDALLLQSFSSLSVDYRKVNPYCFLPPVAPHIAAKRAGETISFDRIESSLRSLTAGADWVVVEGVGGWRVPLGPNGDIGDLAVRLGLPVVLVVGVRLGCINHALLSVESITRRTCLAGWVANLIDAEMAELEENVAELRRLIQAPCLGVTPRVGAPDQLAPYLNIEPLLPLRTAEG